MSILGFFLDPVKDPLSPTGLHREMAARTHVLATQIGALNRKRKDELETLRTTIAKLMLVVETQQRMILQKGLCTQKEFETMMQAIDLEDGTADGQLRRR